MNRANVEHVAVRAMASAHLLVVLVLVTAGSAAAFEMGIEGCPKAHCDLCNSDAVGEIGPATGTLVAYDAATPGSYGLGCTSNAQIVACTFQGETPSAARPNLVVYDPDGHRLGSDGGRLGPSANASVPVVGRDHTIIAADAARLMRIRWDGATLWDRAKPDAGIPLNPIPMISGIVVLATYQGELSTWEIESGELLSHAALTDPDSGEVFETINTPAAAGNRLYVLASSVADEQRGRLIAVDVEARGASRGSFREAWHFDFDGPSGSSPLHMGGSIYFDGRRFDAQYPAHGDFMRVDDLGDAGRLVWKRSFDTKFIASAAADPRGGLWVYPALQSSLLRLSEANGSTVQTVNVKSFVGKLGAYTPFSALSLSTSPLRNSPVVTLGVLDSAGKRPSYVLAIDVGASKAGKLLWKLKVGANLADNWTAPQFPVVRSSAGRARVVFPGANYGTFFVGD